MKVYLVLSAQGEGNQAVCSTLEKGKKCLKKMITDYQAKKYPGSEDDPYPWAGWTWWKRGENAWCFGGESRECAEGSVIELELDKIY